MDCHRLHNVCVCVCGRGEMCGSEGMMSADIVYLVICDCDVLVYTLGDHT